VSPIRCGAGKAPWGGRGREAPAPPGRDPPPAPPAAGGPTGRGPPAGTTKLHVRRPNADANGSGEEATAAAGRGRHPRRELPRRRWMKEGSVLARSGLGIRPFGMIPPCNFTGPGGGRQAYFRRPPRRPPCPRPTARAAPPAGKAVGARAPCRPRSHAPAARRRSGNVRGPGKEGKRRGAQRPLALAFPLPGVFDLSRATGAGRIKGPMARARLGDGAGGRRPCRERPKPRGFLTCDTISKGPNDGP
jgi:hypothetical protein